MTANQLTFIVIVMIISMTVVAVSSIRFTGKIVGLAMVGTAYVHILTTLLGS